ncbi:unnamed protein product [Bursaphelenchus okinawaensis]|uniref:DUF19 domain-containing protein n=1 Tax=Bursaphelenchus okinawaensis TaxID=465554 RepID=A0A811KGG6_9BILA|nr:unnamed protein product [Bursaphelenchus okinawaensis]CAG9103980.1 unnamed protein product [Bursaphelenchus okinawaensis]
MPIIPVIVLVLLFSCCQGRCPDHANDKIQFCVQPVAEYSKVLNKHDNSTSEPQFNALQLPKLGGQVFRELCRLIRDFEVCVADYREPCPKHITINLIEASYGFLCNEGYETFMSSAECLMALDQQAPVKRCHDETLKEIENANSKSNIRMDVKLEYMCGALNYFSACVRQHIWLNCGVEAWHVIFRVLKDTTRTLMPACVFNGESKKLEAEKELELEQLQHLKPTTIPPVVVPQFEGGNTVLQEHALEGADSNPAISFEINEDSEFSPPDRNYAHLDSGSYSYSRSQSLLLSVAIILAIIV